MLAERAGILKNVPSLVVVATLLSSCSSHDGSDRDAMQDPPGDGTGLDVMEDAQVDAGDIRADTRIPDVTDPEDEDGCDPGCHWDCFGGAPLCSDGAIWTWGYGPRPVCHCGDPWPEGGPACNTGTLRECTSGVCTDDTDLYDEYAFCLDAGLEYPSDVSMLWYEMPAEFFKVFCQEGYDHVSGDHCEDDEDCRPASGGRLACDTTAGECVETVRPPLPDGMGDPCDLSYDPGTAEYYVETYDTGCEEACHVGANRGDCVEQGCTFACAFDEDCPEGYMCVCENPGDSLFRICAASTSAATPEERASGLS